MSANALDTIKKSIGGLLVLAAIGIVLFRPEHAQHVELLGGAGLALIGYGSHSARGRALEKMVKSFAGSPSLPPEDVDDTDLVDTVPERPAAKRPPLPKDPKR